jgi:hypothetical protein
MIKLNVNQIQLSKVYKKNLCSLTAIRTQILKHNYAGYSVKVLNNCLESNCEEIIQFARVKFIFLKKTNIIKDMLMIPNFGLSSCIEIFKLYKKNSLCFTIDEKLCYNIPISIEELLFIHGYVLKDSIFFEKMCFYQDLISESYVTINTQK